MKEDEKVKEYCKKYCKNDAVYTWSIMTVGHFYIIYIYYYIYRNNCLIKRRRSINFSEMTSSDYFNICVNIVIFG